MRKQNPNKSNDQAAREVFKITERDREEYPKTPLLASARFSRRLCGIFNF